MVECPELAVIPEEADRVLLEKARQDPAVAAWYIELDQHYQKLGTC